MELTVLAVAVPAAVLGAMAMGLASAAQARATQQVPLAAPLSPQLLVELLGKPLWLVGTAATVGGLMLQLLALTFGPLLLVQPILITALLFASLFSAWLAHRKVDKWIVFGATLCSTGLAAFLLLAQPTGGTGQTVSFDQIWPLTALVLMLSAGCLLSATRLRRQARVLLLALTTGLAYGLTAALMKIVTGLLRSGVGSLFTHPALYLACVVGPLGFVLSQNTFQQGTFVSPALAVITVVDPLVAVLLGMAWFGERIDVTPAVIAGEVVAGSAVVGAIALLARRATQLTERGTRAEAGRCVRA